MFITLGESSTLWSTDVPTCFTKEEHKIYYIIIEMKAYTHPKGKNISSFNQQKLAEKVSRSWQSSCMLMENFDDDYSDCENCVGDIIDNDHADNGDDDSCSKTS